MTEEINPYAVPQTDPAPMPTLDFEGGKKRRNFAIAFAVIILVGSPIASAVAMYDIESIIVSGAILTIAALILIALAVRQDLRILAFLSCAMIAMSLGCFFTIYLKTWSPTQAQKPIGRATVVFAILVQAGWLPVRSVQQAQLAPED